jgi:hypothetical protein
VASIVTGSRHQTALEAERDQDTLIRIGSLVENDTNHVATEHHEATDPSTVTINSLITREAILLATLQEPIEVDMRAGHKGQSGLLEVETNHLRFHENDQRESRLGATHLVTLQPQNALRLRRARPESLSRFRILPQRQSSYTGTRALWLR